MASSASGESNQSRADEIFDRLKKPSSSSSWHKSPLSSQLQSSRPAAVHTDISCGHCGMKPIVGIRYKCSVCDNYDLCQTCKHAPGVHDDKHGMIKLKCPAASIPTTTPAPWAQPVFQPIPRPPDNDHDTMSPTMKYFPPPPLSSTRNSSRWSMEPMGLSLDIDTNPQSNNPTTMTSNYGHGYDMIPYCDGCDKEITEIIYECKSCDDFLYCGQCYTSNALTKHRQKHRFWRIGS